jgi:hypothetical protein
MVGMGPDDTTQQPVGGKSLLDKITEDPDFINRGAADAMEPVATKPVPTPASPALPEHAEPLVLDRDPAFKRVVQPNLLPPRSERPRVRRRGRVLLVAGAVLVVGAGVAAGGYALLSRRPAPVAVATPTPSPTRTPSPTPPPTATPSSTPLPTPTPPPPPQTVTAPAATPTADHPQAVKITSSSGLWLRSSPTSVNRGNIIGWMPNGATISVDSVGDFWWHGVYRGQPGYFAVKYTQ